jgi:adenosylcobalamin-dependent ribonucleoside-triphosphate reductase
LEPYFVKGDPFKTLLARSTYLNKYSRNHEVWTDTIRRVVEGSLALDPHASETEGEMLFHLFWTGQVLPPGRGLWTGGIPGIPADARFNCWYTTLKGIEDWCWAMERLMLGGGVGVGLNEIDRLPGVSTNPCKLAIWCRADHPDIYDVPVNDKSFLNGQTPVYRVADSREGWVEAERRVLRASFEGTDLIVDVSDVRQRGSAIKIFGGTACGPAPLVHLLQSTHEIIRGAAGRKLTSVEALDITNFVGFCVKSGNVRRSALITLGDAEDRPFRDAKKDYAKVQSHRHTSNNSIVFRSWKQIENFDWFSLVADMTENGMGEPGLLNLPLGWRTDPLATGVNPCGEQLLQDHEACNLAEVFPAQFEDGTDPTTAFRLTVRYCLRQRLTPLLDPRSHEVGVKNMRVGVGIGGLCDFPWTPYQLGDWWQTCRREANEYADDLRVNRPLTTTTVKPSGTISLLNGSSPGIHAPWDEYIIRRIRVASNDPMAFALSEAGVPFEYDSYDNTDKTLVFAFPHKAPHARTTVQNQTLRDQFERQQTVQEWWADNAVSATVSFQEHEQEQLPHLLKEFVPRLKSTTCLPASHGYKQAPLESINEETYHKLYAQIDHTHPLVRGGDFEIEECLSGACPVR